MASMKYEKEIGEEGLSGEGDERIGQRMGGSLMSLTEVTLQKGLCSFQKLCLPNKKPTARYGIPLL